MCVKNYLYAQRGRGVSSRFGDRPYQCRPTQTPLPVFWACSLHPEEYSKGISERLGTCSQTSVATPLGLLKVWFKERYSKLAPSLFSASTGQGDLKALRVDDTARDSPHPRRNWARKGRLGVGPESGGGYASDDMTPVRGILPMHLDTVRGTLLHMAQPARPIYCSNGCDGCATAPRKNRVALTEFTPQT